jgi:hypothetical protein
MSTKKRNTQKGVDPRFYTLPDRMEVIETMSGNRRSLSSMQLWEVDDGPVVIESNGESRIFMRGEWLGMDSWEAVFEGRPMSFQMFQEKWPSIVSADAYLASFRRANALKS